MWQSSWLIRPRLGRIDVSVLDRGHGWPEVARQHASPDQEESQVERRAEYKPSLISWNLTRMCNLRCPHCYMEGGRKAENELSTDECLGLIDEMNALGTEMLILTGG